MKVQSTKVFRCVIVIALCVNFILVGCSFNGTSDNSNVLSAQESDREAVVSADLGVGAGMQDGNSLTEYTDEDKLEIEAYQTRFDSILHRDDILANNYLIYEEHIFPLVVESLGNEECFFIPAMEKEYHRLALFIADANGDILYKTNDLETNNRIMGQLKQPNTGLAAVTFSDLNRDGLTDIVFITKCKNESGSYKWRTYKIGDVLFQGEETFYRDWRISDKINRFSMNKSVNSIIAFVRDGKSTEFLYTATTLTELKKHGFNIIEEQDYSRRFEKLGKLQVVPGTYRISEYDIFMIYLVDEQDNIVWCFQPMKNYDNLYTLRGITGKDVDGDGMKDLVVLARYTYEGPGGELMIQSDCSIYYQRTDGFYIDTEFSENYICTEEDTMEELIPKIRAFWGWQVEEENTEEDDQ